MRSITIVRYVKGELLCSPKGKGAKTSQRMEKFYDGSELSTGLQSFAILKLPDGSALKLDPDSNLKVRRAHSSKGEYIQGIVLSHPDHRRRHGGCHPEIFRAAVS